MHSTKELEVVRLLSKAHEAGYRGEEVEEAIRSHVHGEPVSTRIAAVQSYLSRGGVIEDEEHQPPSKMLDGTASTLMSEVEATEPEMIYNGSSFNSWAAAAEYIDRYINKNQKSQKELAEEYNCAYRVIGKKYRKIMDLDVVGRVYAETLPIPSNLSALLAEYRVSIDILRRLLGETTNGARGRIRAAKRHGDHRVESEEFGGVEFYWISPVSRSF